MRLVVFVVLAVILLVPSYSGLDRLPLYGPDPRVTVAPVPLVAGDPARTELGALTYLGGIALASTDPAFGGFSAISTDGGRFLMLSDGGNWMQFDMPRFGHPQAMRLGAIPAGPGNGWLKEDRDTEAMARDPLTGSIWIAFERSNSIWRYSAGQRMAGRSGSAAGGILGPAQAWVAPAAMRDWGNNSGAEAMVRLDDGRFVVLGEQQIDGSVGRYPALLFEGDPTRPGVRVRRFAYRPDPGFRATDAAMLPGGDLLVLTRRFRLPYRWDARLGIVRRSEMRPGAVAVVRTIASFTPPVLTDNYEALAVTRQDDAVIVWIASDDNQSILQRSLLLKFRLDMQKADAATAASAMQP